jgi:uncharacterized Zn finger protein (UPF0148 family)
MPVPATTRIETYTLSHAADLWVSDCPECGIVFGIPTEMQKRRRKDGKEFYCPNGHGMSWHKTEADKEKEKRERAERQLAQERAWRDQAEAEAAHEKRRRAAAQGQVTKMKKRTGKGVCPVVGCKRHFANLEAHMESKHPEYHDQEHH